LFAFIFTQHNEEKILNKYETGNGLTSRRTYNSVRNSYYSTLTGRLLYRPHKNVLQGLRFQPEVVDIAFNNNTMRQGPFTATHVLIQNPEFMHNKCSGDFQIGGQVIGTVKYAADLVLLAREENVLQGMVDRLSEIGRRYGMEMNVEKTKVMRISRQPSPMKIMIYQKQLDNVEYFNYLGT
jgi:hypothetical protein